MSDLILLECLRDGVKADFSNPDTATIAMIQAADLIEAQQAEIARLREALEQAAHNLQAAAKLHQCPGAHKAEQLSRKALEQKP